MGNMIMGNKELPICNDATTANQPPLVAIRVTAWTFSRKFRVSFLVSRDLFIASLAGE